MWAYEVENRLLGCIDLVAAEKRCKENVFCMLPVSHKYFLQVIAMNLFGQNSCRHQNQDTHAEMV